MVRLFEMPFIVDWFMWKLRSWGTSFMSTSGDNVIIVVISWSIEDIGITANFVSDPNGHGWILRSLYQVLQHWLAGPLGKGKQHCSYSSHKDVKSQLLLLSHASQGLERNIKKNLLWGLKHDVEGNRRIENSIRIDKVYKMVGYSLIYSQIIKPWW
jgi:hypothetical protein